MPNFRAPWRDYLNVTSLRAMDANDPIAPKTVLQLAEAEAELAEEYVKKCEELRDAESANSQLLELLKLAEWGWAEEMGCPWCSRLKSDTEHTHDCKAKDWLAAAHRAA